MANDPWMIDASVGAPAYSAAEVRQLHALPMIYGGRAMGARQGIRPGGTQLQVSLVSTTITVAPGLAYVDPGLTTPQGGYWVALTPAETHTLTAADLTNPRKDRVVLRVYDNTEDSSGNRFSRSEYLVGTPGAIPSAPSVPSGAMHLAIIDVPVSGGGSAVVTNAPNFTVATGGILPVRTETERDALSAYDGLTVWRMDLDVVQIHNGSAWRNVGHVSVADLTARGALTGLYDGYSVHRQDLHGLNIYDGSGWRYLVRPSTATVATQQTSGSTSYTDLTTAGPAVTVETGTVAQVTVTCFLFNSGTGPVNFMSYAVSGATTVAASDTRSLRLHSEAANGQGMLSATWLHTGLTAGSNTFTAKYKVNGGTGGWSDRSIIVQPW